jgi:hypothetical protein
MNLSIRDCVGEALRFVRAHMSFVAGAALLGAVVSATIAVLAAAIPQVGLLTSIASTLVQAFIYALLTGAALYGAQAARAGVAGNGARVWAAMAIIGFFMAIVIFVVSIPVVITLLFGPMAPYADDLQTAGSDQSAVMTVMLRFLEENPISVLLTALFYFAIWFLLTSRLYLAAPATVDQKRILTFETWAWTKGATLRILAARLMLLAPAYILAFAINTLVGYGLGADPSNPASIAALAASNLPVFFLFAAANGFVTLALYVPLEAGLSASLYKRLKPAEAPLAA